MKRLKVLMLGWEFPPLISGGLGVACYGISKALANYVELTLIVPKTAGNVKIPGVKLIGLGDLEIKEIFKKEEIKKFREILRKQKIHIEVSPYPRKSKNAILETTSRTRSEKIRSDESRSIHNRFREADLYGDSVTQQVKYYAEIINKIASRLEFDVIHAHDWMTFPAGIRLKEQYNKPLVLHIHSLNFDRIGLERESWIYSLEKKALHLADMILPVSHYTASVISEHYGLDTGKIYPVHNGVDRVKTYRTEKKFPEKLVLFLGRITLQKGPEYFLEAAHKVMQKYPDVRFAIAGTGDKLHEMIEGGAYREISHKLHFTGFVNREKVHTLLSMADVFCMPSVSEPFGLTALEAVQFGVPVVITRRSGAAEVLPDALLADFWDTDQLADHIVNLLSNPSFHAEKVKQGKKIIKQLTWKAAAESIVKGYNKLLS